MSEKNRISNLLEEIEIPNPPKTFIDYHEELGNKQVDTGCVKIPKGYTLMKSFDSFYYYWLKDNGEIGGISSDKWNTVKLAKENDKENGKRL